MALSSESGKAGLVAAVWASGKVKAAGDQADSGWQKEEGIGKV